MYNFAFINYFCFLIAIVLSTGQRSDGDAAREHVRFKTCVRSHALALVFEMSFVV